MNVVISAKHGDGMFSHRYIEHHVDSTHYRFLQNSNAGRFQSTTNPPTCLANLIMLLHDMIIPIYVKIHLDNSGNSQVK